MDLTYFLLYNIRCIENDRKDLLTYIKERRSEQNAKSAIIKKIRDINQKQAEILREIMEKSEDYFTIKEIMQTYTVVYQTARNVLLHLADLGYKRETWQGIYFHLQ